MEASFGEQVLVVLRRLHVTLPVLVEFAERMPSTNLRAKERARAGAPEWSLVVADEQTAGRGRGGHRWVSPPGGLYLSVVLRPRWDPTLLPLAVGVGVAEAVEEWGVRCELKWPNDIVTARGKLGGILIEGATGAGQRWVVVGIGLNVHGTEAELSAAAGAQATSLEALGARLPFRVEVLATIVARLAHWYDALAAGGGEDVRRAWRDRAAPWWGSAVVAAGVEGSLVGIARDIDEWGRLVVERDDGVTVSVSAAEVRELRPTHVDRGGGS